MLGQGEDYRNNPNNLNLIPTLFLGTLLGQNRTFLSRIYDIRGVSVCQEKILLSQIDKIGHAVKRMA